MRLRKDVHSRGTEFVLVLNLAERKVLRELRLHDAELFDGKTPTQFELGVQLPPEKEPELRAAVAELQTKIDARLAPVSSEEFEAGAPPPVRAPEPTPFPSGILLFTLAGIGAFLIVMMLLKSGQPEVTTTQSAQVQTVSRPTVAGTWVPFEAPASGMLWVRNMPGHTLHVCDPEITPNCDPTDQQRYRMWCRNGGKVHEWDSGQCVTANAIGFQSKTGRELTLVYTDVPNSEVRSAPMKQVVSCAPWSFEHQSCTFDSTPTAGFGSMVAGGSFCHDIQHGPNATFRIQRWDEQTREYVDFPEFLDKSVRVSSTRFVGNLGKDPVTVTYWLAREGATCSD